MISASPSHFALIHEILVLDAYLVQPLDPKQKKQTTKRLLNELLSALRMEELGPLGIYPAADERAPGWSFIQPITTSHISGHYFAAPGKPNIRFDVYSCASVNWRKVIDIIHKHLNLDKWHATFIDRQVEVSSKRLVLDIAGLGSEVLDEIDISKDNLCPSQDCIDQIHRMHSAEN